MSEIKTEQEYMRAGLEHVRWNDFAPYGVTERAGYYYSLITGTYLGQPTIAILCKRQFVLLKRVQLANDWYPSLRWKMKLDNKLIGPVFHDVTNLPNECLIDPMALVLEEQDHE